MPEGDGKPQPVVRHYFVDEAGDGVLFSRRGRPLAGTPGCSRYFMLGLADVRDPIALERDLACLRAQLLADPYFSGVPSMHLGAGKTALYFHAKDDLPEVRREVYTLLKRHDCRFIAVVKDKACLLEYVKQRNEREQDYRYAPNELYASMVRRLFGSLLHKHDDYDVVFARRGAADRAAALLHALETTRDEYCTKWGITTSSCVRVRPVASASMAGLQAADYFLWALQRLYERREGRYLGYIWPLVRLVVDLDGGGQNAGGKVVRYTQRKPLSLAAFKGVPGI